MGSLFEALLIKTQQHVSNKRALRAAGHHQTKPSIEEMIASFPAAWTVTLY